MRQPVAAMTAACFCIAGAAWPCAAEDWRDAFDYASLSGGEPAWEAHSATWAVCDGRMEFDGGEKSFLTLRELGQGRRATVEATLVVAARKAPGWAVAGVAVRRDERNYWHLALVEAPEAEGRYHAIELVERYEGRWLANYEGATELARTVDTGGGFRWEYGRPYHLRIELGPDGIEGSVSEVDGTVRRRLGFAFAEGAPAVRAGAPALDAALFAGCFDDVRAQVTDPLPPPQPGPPGGQLPAYELPGWPQVVGERTGFFHTEKHGEAWWLIDPNGRGFYAVGTDHISYKGHWCQALGYAPYGRNMEQKYGSEQRWAAAQAERLRDWGFNLLAANHSRHLRYTHFAHTEWAGFGRSFADIENIVPRTTWTGFPNVFSPRWPRHCDLMARKVCAPNRNDPWLLGYFLDNELEWHGGKVWNNEFGLWEETWRKPPDHTAKQALLEIVRRRCPDLEQCNRALGTDCRSFDELAARTEPVRPATEEARAMAREYARRVAEMYFREAAAAIRRHDPNHMVLGTRFAGWSPGVWDTCGKYCDVVSFNSYPRIDVDRGVPDDVVDQYRDFHRQARKPLMLTEWSFPALDSGLPCRHGAGMRVATQAQKARCFTAVQSTLFSLPFMVGSDYFMYIDEPALGISDTFPEDSNYGLVNEQDEPWPELTAAAAALNPRACELHAAGALDAVYPASVRLTWDREPPETQAAQGRLFRTGPLELRRGSGGDAWAMLFEGKPLGTFFPLIHQKAPDDQWTRPDAATVTDVREDRDFVVVDMDVRHRAGGPGGAPAYAAGWRFWVPKQSSGWFAAQSLWVENTDEGPWTLAGLFHYTRPVIGGSQDGDRESTVNVPNFYIPFAAWEDPDAGWGQAVFGYGDGLKVAYWKDQQGFHSDCREDVDVPLAPGERYSAVGPLAVHFGYRVGEQAALFARLDKVRNEALALRRPNDEGG